MSGHSKWNNIKRKKEKTDGAKAKVFTKVGRELAVAVKEGGGPNQAANSKLKDCIAKAMSAISLTIILSASSKKQQATAVQIILKVSYMKAMA